MGDVILNLIWCGLVVWTCLAPAGYGPYLLLGFNGGDFLATLYCGLRYGYLREEGDFHLGRFVISVLGFALLGGFYVGKLSFVPGSDAYACALYFIFASFWLTFGYRLYQYRMIPLLRQWRALNRPTNDQDLISKARNLRETCESREAPTPLPAGDDRRAETVRKSDRDCRRIDAEPGP